jgi:purine-binding chemotaxis protein CheW
MNHLLVFTLNGYRYALDLSHVERVFRSVEITPLPKAPEIVLGVVNVQGSIVPVVNVRKRFRLQEREAEIADQLILTRTLRHTIALLVDSVAGVMEILDQDIVTAQNFLPNVEYVEGVLKLRDGIVLIHNIDTFFSLDEEAGLGQAVKNMASEDDT